MELIQPYQQLTFKDWSAENSNFREDVNIYLCLSVPLPEAVCGGRGNIERGEINSSIFCAKRL